MYLPANYSPKPSPDAKYFGIDLGTTYTLVTEIDSSLYDPQSEDPLPVKFVYFSQASPLAKGGKVNDDKVASIVAFYEGKFHCGNLLYPLKGNEEFQKDVNIFYHWKLQLGIDRHPLYQNAIVPDLDTPAKVAGKVLNFCRASYLRSKDAPLPNTVITVPASFQVNQRQDVLLAARYAKVEVSDQMLIDEPNAAFLGYFNNLPADKKYQLLQKGKSRKNVLVFDFGGGTCDLSILEVGFHSSKGLLIGNKAISRYNDLGGQDIDEIIAQEILYPRFLEEFGIKDDMPLADLERVILPQLSGIAELLKKGIVNLMDARFGHQNLADQDLSSVVYELEERSLEYKDITYVFPKLSINGETFADIIHKIFRKQGHDLQYSGKHIRGAKDTLDEVLQKANLSKEDVDVILPVGGSSYNPVLLYELQVYFPKSECWVPEEPDKVVAAGAAIYSFFFHRFGKSLIQPIVSDTIGVETKGPSFYPLIEKGLELPVRVSLPDFRLQNMDQKEISIPICMNNLNYELQEIRIPIPGLHSGMERIKIEAELDLNKVLHLEVHMDEEPILNFQLENPFFFGSLSKNQVEFVQLAKNLETARAAGDNNRQRWLMKELMKKYFDLGNDHELTRLAEEYLDKYDDEDPGVLNYKYIGNDHLGRKDAAMATLERAIDLDPEATYLRFNMSLQIESTEGPSEALDYLRACPSSVQRGESIRLRMLLLRHKVGENVQEEAAKEVHNYENDSRQYSEHSRKNLIPQLFRVTGRQFTRQKDETQTRRASNVLIASNTPTKQ